MSTHEPTTLDSEADPSLQNTAGAEPVATRPNSTDTTTGTGTTGTDTIGTDAIGTDTTDAGTGDRAPRRRRPRLLTAVAVFAVVAFALIGIGSPLLGRTVFAPTDELSTRSPYLDAGGLGTQVQNTYMDDTYTAAIPNVALYAEELKDGRAAQWNPYISGGEPLGATPNYALYSPLTTPFYVLPAWLAPAYMKLLEIICAVTGTFLYLRRLRLSPPAAITGGLAFASSAFMIVWTNWPQTRVAAFIPFVFWGIERLVQERRARDGALLALPVAAMLLGGFPAVTAYTLYTAGAYALVRVLAEYRTQWRRVIGVLAAAGVAVVAGAALAAIQLLPFAAFYSSWLIEGRGQTADQHLSIASLVTSIAPWALGSTDPDRPPYWYLSENLVESLSFTGAVVLVLALVAVAAPRAARATLPRGVWSFLVAGAGVWFTLIYIGWLPLAVAQRLPALGANFIGRSRSILGFLVAVLAAVGLELLLQRRAAARAGVAAVGAGVAADTMAGTMAGPGRIGSEPSRWAGLWPAWLTPGRSAVLWGLLVWGVAGLIGTGAWVQAHQLAAATQAKAGGDTHRVATLNTAMAGGLALVALTMAAAALLWWGGSAARPASTDGERRLRWAHTGVAALLTILVAVEGLMVAVPYYPRVDKDTFYPVTDVHEYLAEHLDHERFVGTKRAMIMGADSAQKLRALSGHGFINEQFATMLRGMPGNPVPYPTYIRLTADAAQLSSPVLDRLGVKYAVTSPRDPVFGTTHKAATDGTTATLTPDQEVTARVPTSGPLRAVGLVPTTVVDPAARIEVSLRDDSGTEVAHASKLAYGMRAEKLFLIPVAAETVPAGTALTAELTVTGDAPLTVRGSDGGPALTTVTPEDDGLQLAHAGSAVIWERTRTLPRVRWASRTEVESDEARRVSLLASGALPDDTVLLDAAGAATDGKPATVDVGTDGTDTVEATVDAQGAGYLVLADAIQEGWSVTVDGEAADLVAADEGVAAVAVPAGRHTVRFSYSEPWHGAGTWFTLGTIVLLAALVGGETLWLRRRRKATPRLS